MCPTLHSHQESSIATSHPTAPAQVACCTAVDRGASRAFGSGCGRDPWRDKTEKIPIKDASAGVIEIRPDPGASEGEGPSENIKFQKKRDLYVRQQNKEENRTRRGSTS
ncbi:hypothetical protein NDU88_002121 [Pleurodeles waltl]|uniref:Uncharacterized protein n=1 Tax=Pleurodeles waltl TaxID=8319 RepID=A0AAV7TJX3_PLEWA|nr:hypothetical protein NDU88_002121 [Pleurodeles waltl]